MSNTKKPIINIDNIFKMNLDLGMVIGFIALISLIFLTSCNRTNDTTQPPPQDTDNEVQTPQSNMSFFVTSVGIGNGANLGGLDGADMQCQKLAQSVDAGDLTWRAYLSTQGTGAINARDRIGNGPWINAKGEVIANNITELHSANNNITKQTALTEKGEIVNGRGDTPNMHDILTGSQPDGTAFTISEDRTCGNWTISGTGAAMVGHSDRIGLDESDAAKSWNSSHLSRGPDGGCSQNDLISTGGNGLLYCFAVN